MSDKDNAVEKAIAYEERRLCEKMTQDERDIFENGYNAGLEASKWVRIETEDDLPKEDGEYLWRYRSNNAHKVQVFTLPRRFSNPTEYWVGTYSHWMPIPTQEKQNETI